MSHRTAKTMTRDEAIAIARTAAAVERPGYVPASAEDFTPDQWVIDAIQEAYATGHTAGMWWQADRDHWGPGWD